MIDRDMDIKHRHAPCTQVHAAWTNSKKIEHEHGYAARFTRHEYASWTSGMDIHNGYAA
jgi:hypothetical protein